MIIDAHVTIGRCREVELDVEELLLSMDEHGVDVSIVSPPEAAVAVLNREGNELVAAAAGRAEGRLRAYAVATPWTGRAALDELRRAHDAGAVALKLDPALQGFDPLDGLVDPLLELAAELGWPVYVRTGTPPHALPLALSVIARRHEAVSFVMGKSGATDFSADGPLALADASNVYADSAHVEWPTRYARDHPGRVVFTTDSPFAAPALELARVAESGLPDGTVSMILGGTMHALLGW